MLSIFIAYIFEILFSKPKQLPQPVEAINSITSKIENYLRRRARNAKLAGVCLVLAVAGIVFLVVEFIVWDFGLLGKAPEILAKAVFIYTALSIKSVNTHLAKLKDAARGIDNDQLIRSRLDLVSENTLKDIVGVLFYAFFAGVGFMWVYKSINMLCDSIGHKSRHSEDLGWFVLRLEAIFNYVPSRICVLLVPFASYMSKMGFKNSFYSASREGITNNAPCEAAFAGALGVQLGGLVYYGGMPAHRPYVGKTVNELNQGLVEKALKIMYAASFIMILAMITVNYFWNVL